MTLSKKCDICGALYEYKRMDEDPTEPINGISLVHNYFKGYYEHDRLDCCPDCMRSIQDLIESLKKKGEKGK